MQRKYLFVLSPPASGSTVLWSFLQTSPSASAFSKEGQWLDSVKPILGVDDRWNPLKKIPWGVVKEKWEEVWDLSKPILLEKSPPHLVRAQKIEKNFPNSYFLLMVRSPYAFCEGEKRRHIQDDSYYNIAKFWVICSKFQIENIKKLKNSIYFTYEELTENPTKICKKILSFVPQLKVLNVEEHFQVFENSMQITNLNSKQISRLTDRDIFKINLVLKEHPDVMSFFGYDYLEPKTFTEPNIDLDQRKGRLVEVLRDFEKAESVAHE